MVRNTPQSHSIWFIPDPLRSRTGTELVTKVLQKIISTGIKSIKLQKVNFTVVSSPTTGLDLFRQKKLDLTELSSEQVKITKMMHSSNLTHIHRLLFEYNFKDPDATNRRRLITETFAVHSLCNRRKPTRKVLGDGSTVPMFVPRVGKLMARI